MGLCLNAAEAMTGGGRLTVRTYREPGDGRVVLEVSDTGPGIDAKTMSRIFEPFFTTKGVGRGMGLAAIRGSSTSTAARSGSSPGKGRARRAPSSYR